MAQKTSVHRNRITIDDRTYEARVLGGGKFNVFTTAGVQIGSFQVRGRSVEVEELGVEGADPVEQIGLLWVGENLSAQPVPFTVEKKTTADAKPAEAPAAPTQAPAPAPVAKPAEPVVDAKATGQSTEPSLDPDPEYGASIRPQPLIRSICRIATHGRPDANGFQMAKVYQKWLRSQPGVQAAYLSHDPESGKTVSITIWESKEHLAAMRYAKPPAGAAQLKSVSVELLWVVG